jgi:hypothetical protein
MGFIRWPVFFISLAVGLFFVYMVQPKFKEVLVFPTPENIDKIQYMDHSETCYEFQEEEIACPAEKQNIENYSVQ